MFSNAIWGNPINWHMDRRYNTKSQWHLSWENNFIAAEKNTEFIKEWFDVYTEWMVTSYSKI